MRPRVYLALAVLFFFGPLALLALGSRPAPFENRAPAPRPSFSQGWAAIDDATRYLAEHLPLRADAVRANTRLSQDVFAYTPVYGSAAKGEAPLPFAAAPAAASPAPATAGTGGAPKAAAGGPPGLSAVQGKDGWLFLEQDFDYACAPPVTAGVAVARWQRLARAIRDSGRTVNVIVGPDKSEAYADQLPDRHPKLACRAAKSSALWAAIGAGGDAFTPNLRDVIRDARAAGGGPVYYRRDTHWNEPGALAATKALVRTLAPRVPLRDDDTTALGDQPYPGDLNKMLGVDDQDVAPRLALTRVGAGKATPSVVRVAGVDTQVTRRVGATAPMVEGRTLFIHDSFGWVLQPQLSQYVRHLTSVTFLVGPAALAALIARSDHVIFETGQREFINRSGLYAGLTEADIAKAAPAG